MKKIKSNNSFKIVALIAVVAIAAVNVKIAMQDYVPALNSGLMLKNIEALATESGELYCPSGWAYCITKQEERKPNETTTWHIKCPTTSLTCPSSTSGKKMADSETNICKL
jgi:hypothetical protein